MSTSVNSPALPTFESLEPRLLLTGWDGYEVELVNYNNQINLSASSADATRILDNQDDGSAVIDIGTKRFNFFEQSFTGASASVSVNGAVSFDGLSLPFTNQALSSITAPVNVLAPMWDDWVTERVGAVYYKVTSSELIIQWYDVEHWESYSGGGFLGQTVRFSLVLELHNDAEDQSVIEFNYADTSTNDQGDDAASATVGIRGRNLDETEQYSHNVRRQELQGRTLRYTPVETPYVDIIIETDLSHTTVPEPSPKNVLMPGDAVGTYWMKVSNIGNTATGSQAFTVDVIARSVENPTTTVNLGSATFTADLRANGSSPRLVRFDVVSKTWMTKGKYTLEYALRDTPAEGLEFRTNNVHMTAAQFHLGGAERTFGSYRRWGKTTTVKELKADFDGTYLSPFRIRSARTGQVYTIVIHRPDAADFLNNGFGYFTSVVKDMAFGALLSVDARTNHGYIFRNKTVKPKWKLSSGGLIRAALRNSSKLFLDITVVRAGWFVTRTDIDIPLVVSPYRSPSPQNWAEQLLVRASARGWVAQVLGYQPAGSS